MFKLDKRLEKDTFLIKNLENFQVRLMNAKDFFWIVLIPNKANLIELSDLNINERNYLMNFAIELGKFIKTAEKYDKVNIGMLGNVVSQLHLHVVLRKIDDTAWPRPVWGMDFNYLDEKTKKYRSELVSKFVV
ncbi:HIT domain-containing protein [Alphaproteobacteria bacterium]|nr:HIT domain-containing protein [Alphaproteobacteria bacterium]MDB2387950.1 HIT domain-containing protein [Alphaproteobacteria bacterium]MDC6452366.1 HIT domain-containing protein [Alphaproteobacteria bacterium]